MCYEIIETYLKGKVSEELCEDGIVVTPNHVAVIDGSTAKNGFIFNGKTTGRNAMEIISSAIKELPANMKMPDAVSFISTKIRRIYEKYGFAENMEARPHERFTASAVIYSIYYNEIWMIGDCQCLINGTIHKNEKPVDHIMAEARSAFDEVELLRCSSIDELQKDDTGRDFIKPFLQKQAILQNSASSPLGYSVFDGFDVLLNKVKVIKVRKGSTVVLASDGYPVLCSTLAESEQKLHDILRKDPLCIHEYKSTKGLLKGNCSFDDRSYIKVKCNE